MIERVLNGRATETEADGVAAWFATREGQEWLGSRMDRATQEISDGTTPLAENIPTEELLARIDRYIARRRRLRVALVVAAAVVPCLLIAGMWADVGSRLGGGLFPKTEMAQEQASYGERKEVIFQDGSRVWLNAGSVIEFPRDFALTERCIRLSGEAFFDVQPNARRPFRIQTADAEVRVLGTELNVRAYPNERTVSVVLIKGKVEFLSDGKRFEMKPSQRLVYSRDDRSVRISDEQTPDRGTLWKDNIICFRDASLREVITTLERWYDVEFDVEDAAAYGLRFSLSTPEVPLDALLEEMQRISDLSFARNDRRVSVRME